MGIRLGIGGLKIGQRSTGVDWSSYWTTQYDAVYQAMTTKPTGAIMQAQSQFVKALVDGGVWAKLDRLFIFSSHTNDAGEALLDWIHPTGTPAVLAQTGELGLPVFTAYEGFLGTADGGANNNGGYINTQFNPSVGTNKYTLNEASFGFYRRTADAAGQSAIDMGSLADLNYLVARNASTNWRGTVNSAANYDNRTGRTTGLMSEIRKDATTINDYYNTTASTDRSINATAIPNAVFSIGGLSGARKTHAQYAMGYVGGLLTATDVGVLFNAFEKYQQANGKSLFLLSSPFYMAKITTYGDSLTAQGGNVNGWVWLMNSVYQTTTNNMGWGARTLKDILSQERIETEPADTDLIIISGGNYAYLGTIADSDPTVSLFGALNNAVRWFKTNRPSAEIVLVTPPHRLDEEDNMNEQRQMYIDVAAAESVGLCDLHILCGITQDNVNSYTIDGVHLNDAGNQIYYSVLVTWLNENY